MGKGRFGVKYALMAMIFVSVAGFFCGLGFEGSSSGEVDFAYARNLVGEGDTQGQGPKLLSGSLGSAGKSVMGSYSRYIKASDASILSSVRDVVLERVGEKEKYEFMYGSEKFKADYEKDGWVVYDSFKIVNHDDIVLICQALIDIHPVYGKDFKSFRTAQDMAFEWEQHNLAYQVLLEGNRWREHAKDVDLDPYDQGMTLSEMYERRTGKKIDYLEIIKRKFRSISNHK